ncbi:hypothetical protein LWI29_004059 [Acer saccharum]|uniref:Integrase catalytic domain-containing protein n=1 Tax=Acer saccharum TaxID=4024 RepID=A0AA39TQC6_ACESA|nr:hypothetical protein LWI29_004059 [Acer saccharum]
MSVEFFPDYFLVKDLTTGASLVRGQNKGNLYVWPQSSRPSHSVSGAHQFFMSSQHNVSSRSWHSRLGHPSQPILQRLISSHCLPVTKSETSVSLCSACLCNKSHKLPFGISTLISNKPFEILFTDVWGPAHIQSFDKNKYYVIFVDYFSKYTWLYPLKNKSDVPTVFRRFKLLVENFFNTRIKTVYSDGSGETQSLGLDLQNLGIQHLKSPPHTPEHVGTAECKHRHVVETALTLLHHASMPPKYWSLAFSTAVYLINRMPTKVLGYHSPYFRLFGKEPNYRKLRIFGCLCYTWLRPYTSHKLQPRSRPCVFVGYSTEHSAYLCLDRSTGKSGTAYLNDPPQVEHSLPDIILIHVPPVPTLPLPPGVLSPLSTPLQVAHLPPPKAVLLPPAPLSHTGRPPHASHSAEAPAQPESALPPVSPASPPPNVIQTRSRNQIFKPKAIFDLHATTHAAPLTEPTSLIQAQKFMEWRNAMSAECDALVSNGTWTLVPSHSSQNVVGCKWIFRIKRHLDGSVARYKARLVAKGFHQRPSIDFIETFNPIVKPVTVRLILTLAVTNGWHLRQLDVNNAFLQGSLSDDVYMTQPPGFVDSTKPHHVCKLQKRFMASDRPLALGSSESQVGDFIAVLAFRFSLKDLGQLSFFLGVEAVNSTSGIFLSQQKYIRDLLARTNMLEANTVSTPISLADTLKLADGSTPTDVTQYRQVVGSLQYLSLTSSDVSFAVNKLS